MKNKPNEQIPDLYCEKNQAKLANEKDVFRWLVISMSFISAAFGINMIQEKIS